MGKNRIIGNKLLTLLLKTFKVAFLIEIANCIASVTDGVIVGRLLGPDAAAAYGIGAPYFSYAFMFIFLFSQGTPALCANFLGKMDTDNSNRVFSTSLFIGVLLSVILCVLGIILSPKLVILLGAKGENAFLGGMAADYMRGLFLGLPFSMVNAILMPILQMDGKGNVSSLSGIAVFVADVFFDLFFVKVLGLGLFYVGLSTSISFMSATVILLISHLRDKEKTAFRFSLSHVDLSKVSKTAKYGAAWSMYSFAMLLGLGLMNSLALSTGGSDGMVGMMVRYSFYNMVNSVGFTLSSSLFMLLGFFHGDEDKKSVLESIRCSVVLILILDGIVAVLGLIFAKEIAWFIIGDEQELLPLCATAVRFTAVTLPIYAICDAFVSILQILEKNTKAILIYVFRGLVFLVPTACLLKEFYGIVGVYAAYTIAPILSCLLAGVFLLWQKKQNALFVYPKPENTWILSQDIHTLQDVMTLSETVSLELKKRNVSKAAHVALCIEEVGRNVIEHGFKTKDSFFNIRVTNQGNVTELRFREDCAKFNIKEKMELLKPDLKHPEANIGLRLIHGIAKETEYNYILGYNNYRIRLDAGESNGRNY